MIITQLPAAMAPAADRPPCTACGHVVLCARCAKSDGARLIHDDECASLRSLFAAPVTERPADSCSLRLLLRLLLWRWRRSRPELPQYVEDEWWGDGDACGDERHDGAAGDHRRCGAGGSGGAACPQGRQRRRMGRHGRGRVDQLQGGLV